MKTTTDNQTFSVPKPVYLLLDRLCSSGYEAYLVGGCVRDLLLGAIPHDFDVTTSAPPHRVQQLFHGYTLSASGIRFGTVGVKTDCGMVEITTFRTEGGYEDGRHPGQVQFGGGLESDLLRRDFLMNAVCLTKDGVLLDPLGGERDILEKRITACGNPAARFREDALRVLRGVRFACQLGFTVEHSTLTAMREAAAALSNLPVERLSGELCRLLLSPSPSRLFTEFSWCLSPLFPAFHLKDPDRLNLLPAALPERLLPLPQLAQGLQLPRADRARLAQLKEIWDLLPMPDRQAARLLS